MALVPDVVRRLRAAEHEVVVEPGAGADRGRDRRGLRRRRARRSATRGAPRSWPRSRRRRPRRSRKLARGTTILVGFLNPLGDPDGLEAIAATGATALAMEKIPRISRAQSMDALSSQATVSGYRAVLIAATELPRFFPMFMTAAGTVPPAQVLVLGAGVAGLQAIATARRLGAVVTGVRHPQRGQGADPVAGREVLRGRGDRRRRGRGRLRARADARGAADPARRVERADGQVRRDRHHRARARPAGAEADPGRPRWR